MKTKGDYLKSYKFLNLIVIAILMISILILIVGKSYLFKSYSIIRGFKINELSKVFIQDYLWSLFLGSIVAFFILLNFKSLRRFLEKNVLNLTDKKLFLIIFIFNLILGFSLLPFINENFMNNDSFHYMNVARSIYNGEGYASHSLEFMGIRPKSIPYPDFFKPPLFSTILAVSYSIFGLNFFAAKIVNIILGSFLAPLTFLFMLRISKSVNLALLASAITTFDWILIRFRGAILSDMIYWIFTLLAFILMYKAKKKYHYALLGVVIALAYLTRYPGFYLLFPTLLVYEYVKNKNIKRIVSHSIIVFSVFLIVASPWLIRNYVEYGSPTYSYLIFITGHTYENGHHFFHPLNTFWDYIYRLEKPQTLIDLILDDPLQLINKMWINLKFSFSITPFFVINNPFLFLLFLLGCFVLFKTKEIFYPLIFYIASSYILYSTGAPSPRFYYSLIPIFAIFIAYGIRALYLKLNTKKLAQSFLITLIILILSTNLFFGFSSVLAQSRPSTEFAEFQLFVKKISNDIIKNIEDDKSVMVNYDPYTYNYFSNKNAVQFPIYKNDKEFFDVIRDYKVRYIIYYDKYSHRFPQIIPPTDKIIKSSYKIQGGKVYEVLDWNS